MNDVQPAATTHRRRTATRDREAAHAHLVGLYPTFTPRSTTRGPFSFEDSLAQAGDLSSHHVRYGGGLDFAHEEAPGHLIAFHVVHGRLRLPGPDGDVLLGPGDSYVHPLVPHEGHADRAHVMLAALPTSVVETALRASRETAGSAQDDGHVLNLRTGRVGSQRFSRYWAATLWNLHRQLVSPQRRMAHPLTVDEATRHLAASLVMTFPGIAGRSLASTGADVLPRVVRRAVDFMDENAQRPISPSDVAEAAGVGVRALQVAFRKHLDTTPHRYLRRVRLEHAHAELRRSDAARTTVADVAAHWGFLHPGRFSQYHREAFGTWPKDTLAG